MDDLKIKCTQCPTSFPYEWILKGTNGAKKIGLVILCSIGCEKAYFSQGLKRPARTGIYKPRNLCRHD